eukprot:GEZU01042735.1.p1 GENE.GEZU01042735.1~~GEZU01042735.1.p1  ORF type:complete len:934 (-),score=381.24 GEZU01042735.1:29-2830(-)
MEKQLEAVKRKAKQARDEFFGTTKRGEIPEWKVELNSDKEPTRKEALKKVIAAMTVGKDVSVLFPDVVKCVSTNNIEMKKLVYLYIMNYAKNQQDLAILAVNTFIRDSQHSNPLVRALAVRTMGCIRVDRITEYLAEPLRKALKDEDPYVRKTAAVAVAKLYDLSADLVIEQGFIDALKELLADSNPMVVANAVAALAEISETTDQVTLEFTGRTVNTLLAALNECTEWGQVFILDSLIHYNPKDEKEAETIAERILPRLQHANSAVVLSAVKIIMKCMDLIKNKDTAKALSKKLAAPLVTLLNAEPEIQYVALRNIDLIVQKRPGILNHEIKVFFCKYNDPIYVKMEKLEIMIKLASERNIDTVLAEFKEYATEIDVEFVRKSVRAIGRCAIKLERAAQRCIDVLLELIKTKVNYVVQEAVIVIKDIFRKYPNQYESIIGTLCENLDTLDEPEAKASMIWIIGEYAERIENADELLEVFIDTFHDETAQVQLQLLTATVKLFLKRPSDTQAIVQRVLSLSTEESDNPDLRDRGYVYWRLLSTDPEATRAVVLAEKPTIDEDSDNIAPALLDELCKNISTLASVYHKPPELFVPDYNTKKKAVRAIEEEEEEEEDEVEYGGDSNAYTEQEAGVSPAGGADLLDLSGLSISSSPSAAAAATTATTAAATAAPAAQSLDDLLGLGSPAATPAAAVPSAAVVPKTIVLPAARGNGMQILAAFTNDGNQLFLNFTFENHSQQPLTGFQIQFNKNTFGIAPTAPLNVTPAVINPGTSGEAQLPMGNRGVRSDLYNRNIQIALKNNTGVYYFQAVLPLSRVMLTAEQGGRLERGEFLAIWKSIPDENERQAQFPNTRTTDLEAIKRMLEDNRVYFIAKRSLPGQENLYFSAKLPSPNDVLFVVELVVFQGQPGCRVSVKTANVEYSDLFIEDLKSILTI